MPVDANSEISEPDPGTGNKNVVHTDKDGTPQGLTLAEIASICHEANRQYRLSQNEDPGPHWDEAPAYQQASVIKGVMAYYDNPDQTPQQSHEKWLAHYKTLGWKFGPVKNSDTKEHPCYLPYKELPLFQQRKDALFRAIVLALKG